MPEVADKIPRPGGFAWCGARSAKLRQGRRARRGNRVHETFPFGAINRIFLGEDIGLVADCETGKIRLVVLLDIPDRFRSLLRVALPEAKSVNHAGVGGPGEGEQAVNVGSRGQLYGGPISRVAAHAQAP